MLVNEQSVIIDCNEAVLKLLNVTREGVLGGNFHQLGWGVVREDGSPFPVNDRPVNVALATGEPTLDLTLGVDIPGQARRWLTVNTYPSVVDGVTTGVITSYIDITEKRRRDRALQLLSEVHRFVMFAADETDVLQQLCDAIVKAGGFTLAWVGVTSATVAGDVEILSAAGATGYLEFESESPSKSNDLARGLVTEALSSGETQVINDSSHQIRDDRWRERVVLHGFASIIVLPLMVGRPTVMAIYDERPFAFDALTVESLEATMREVELGVALLRSVKQTEATLQRAMSAMEAQSSAERAQNLSEQRFRLAFQNNMAPMVFSDLQDRAVAVNDAFCRMVGFTREELLGHDSKKFTYPDDVDITDETHERFVTNEVDQLRYVTRYLRKDGRIVVAEVLKSAARDSTGKTLYFVTSQRDITEEQAMSKQLSHQALHDPLTGLANRALFEDRLAQAQARVGRSGGFGAVLLLDLDDFKGVNDTHGHLVGDQLLVGVAHRLDPVIRASDTLCRLGGDEFLYLAEAIESPDEVERIAARILAALAEPFIFDGVRLVQHASIGIAIFDPTLSSSTECLRYADAAMYEAKRQGKGHYVVFTSSMGERAVSRFTLVQELRHALQSGQLSMHYQPVVDLATSVVVGFEALMRWKHPEQGMVPPNVFIPLAEESDLILELGVFALREAVAAASTWTLAGDDAPRPYVTVNMSARQFHDPRLLSTIGELLTASDLGPDRLILEITESVTLLDVAETLSVVDSLHQLGVRIALDDFGTGYSSLSYLTLMNPRIIKIDRSFVSPCLESERNDALLETIISLGHKLNTIVLAEGIETRAQYERLCQLECELGQGFLFSAAVPANEVAAILARSTSDWW